MCPRFLEPVLDLVFVIYSTCWLYPSIPACKVTWNCNSIICLRLDLKFELSSNGRRYQRECGQVIDKTSRLKCSDSNNICRICTGYHHSYGHPQIHLPLLSSPKLVFCQGCCENICKMFSWIQYIPLYQLGFLCRRWQKTLSQIALRRKFTIITYEEHYK